MHVRRVKKRFLPSLFESRVTLASVCRRARKKKERKKEEKKERGKKKERKKEGRKRKERKKERRKEGKKEGKKERKKEGRKERKKERRRVRAEAIVCFLWLFCCCCFSPNVRVVYSHLSLHSVSLSLLFSRPDRTKEARNERRKEAF